LPYGTELNSENIFQNTTDIVNFTTLTKLNHNSRCAHAVTAAIENDTASNFRVQVNPVVHGVGPSQRSDFNRYKLKIKVKKGLKTPILRPKIAV